MTRIILATGTNGDRAVATHDVDHYQSTTYFDMLLDKNAPRKFTPKHVSSKYSIAPNMDTIPGVDFFQVDFSKLADDEDELNPSWTKVLADPAKGKGFIVSTLKTLFTGESKYEFATLDNMVGDVTGVMLFLPGSTRNDNLEIFANIASEVLEGWKVLPLTGKFTNGRKAEDYTKAAIKEAAEEDKKVLIISAGLGSRSYSITEINTVVLMYDGGSAAATGQKMSRCLTRGQATDKIGHIVSVSLDPSRDDKLDEAILETAVKTAEKEESEDFTATIKKVLRSLNIYMFDENGDKIEVNVDDYTAKIMASRSLTRVVGKTVNIDKVLENPEFIQKLLGVTGEIVSLGKAEAIAKLGKKYAYNEKKSKKTVTTEAEQEAKDTLELIKKIRHAIQVLADNAGHIASLGESTTMTGALKNIINSNTDCDNLLFAAAFNIEPEFALELIEEGVVNTHLMDLVIHQQVAAAKKANNDFWAD